MTTVTEVKLPEKWSNPRILEWARVRMGLGYEAVGKKLDVPTERIINWERNSETPTLSDLEKLADIYDCPVGYFFLNSPPEEKLELDCRGLKSERAESLSYESHLSLSEFVTLTDYVANLIGSMKIPNRVSIGEASLDMPIESIASREREIFGFTPELRARWGTANEAYEFWKSVIEARGVFVIALKLNPQEIRGASRWDANYPPAILVNRSDMESATGRCFTLLHEWAHLMLKKPGLVCDFHGQSHTSSIENFANRFAAEVLVPKSEFKQYLIHENMFEKRNRWGDDKIINISRHFWVSKDVIAIMIEESDLAYAGFYRDKLNMWYARKPFFRHSERTRRGNTKIKRRLAEIGMPMAKIISSAYDSSLIPELELAHLLKMKVENAEGFVSWVKEGAKESYQTR